MKQLCLCGFKIKYCVQLQDKGFLKSNFINLGKSGRKERVKKFSSAVELSKCCLNIVTELNCSNSHVLRNEECPVRLELNKRLNWL